MLSTQPDPAFEVEDIFALDTESRQRLDQIATRIRANDHPRLFDFTPAADDHQRPFIASTADPIRLLAPAGSGKTQSVVNRILREVSQGGRLDEHLVLTFDNAAALALRERFDAGLRDLPH